MFGGGEPALQSRFIAEFCKICDSRLHIYLETSLNIPIENLKELIPSVDAYVVDIKDMDSKVYSRYTGKSNRKMIRNLKYMVDNGYADKIEIRVPLIPGFNTEHNVENSITKLKAMGFTKLDRFTYKTIVQSNHRQLYKKDSNEMNYGKAVCEVLKQIRTDIARMNGVEYAPYSCQHKQCATSSCLLCKEEL